MNDDPVQPARPARAMRPPGLLGLRRHPSGRLLRQWLVFVRRKKRGKNSKDTGKVGE
jgi:hypothetical protein